MMYQVMKGLGVAQKDPRLIVSLGNEGCIADAVQALSGATFGNRRLICDGGSVFKFTYGDQSLHFVPKLIHGMSVEDVLTVGVDELFAVEPLT